MLTAYRTMFQQSMVIEQKKTIDDEQMLFVWTTSTDRVCANAGGLGGQCAFKIPCRRACVAHDAVSGT
jgi:hypothetical protein